MKFELALKSLEDITAKMESGQLPLDEMLKLYDKGIMLCAECSAQLENAKGKITEIKVNDGEIVETESEII